VVAAAAALVTTAAVMGAAASPGAASPGSDLGRQSRTSGVAIAGADIFLWSRHRSVHDGGGCTLSFTVSSAATGRSGSLTAGHCVGTLAGGPTYDVQQTRSGSGDVTYPGVSLGNVARGQSRLGRDGDSAFMALAPGRSARPAVFTGGVTTSRTIPVGGLAKLHDGLRVCYSGAASGEHCGFRVVGHPRSISFPDGRHTYRIRHEWRATRATCTSRSGDSGSPVYVKRDGSAYAVGILSGAQRGTGKCPFYFTPVSTALHSLGLHLVSAR
jgi:hypothetical protein